ncbi:carboxylesterase family protein [Streptomyces triticagri]|uniref:carboxylesterase family protein n=1 Tax=Streptomyces triticagri TaxID=2293568 RepID=UPI0013141100|nr:alpha/beta fold hydrolase [Streptomyces triticagri]
MAADLQTRSFKVDDTGNELPYVLSVPGTPPGTAAARGLPLLLFLHGASERGDDPRDLAAHGPVKQLAEGGELPFVVLAPQCPAYSTWAVEVPGVYALLEEIVEEYGIDQDRVYVTGLSMGGAGSWAIAARYPQRFAAAVPICGSWLPEAAERIGTLPVWTFHGEDDENIPVRHTEKIVEALHHNGNQARFTRYPGVGHDSWTRTYDNPEVYDWLLAQRRGG